jgi:tetratricopeptide (TPR) repeat protein
MKFKNIKKKAKKAKSPSNSRTIHEQFKLKLPKVSFAKLVKLYGGVLKYFVIAIFIIAVVIVGYDFQKNLRLKQNIDSQREALTKELNFWKDFISKHQNYRDAYFQASILEYKLGDTLEAKKYVEKGLILDPNSADGKKLEKFLLSK